MITDDEVMRLFEEADPARAIDTAPVPDAVSYLDTLRSSSDVPAVETVPASIPAPRPRGRRFVFAVAAVSVLVLGAVALISREDESGTSTRATPPVPESTTIPEVARPPSTVPGDASTTAPLVPEGAPSAPATGELVASVGNYFGGGSGGAIAPYGAYYLYADGRLLSASPPDAETLMPGRLGQGSGFVEQRLTPQGIERVRSEFLTAGPFNANQPTGNILDCIEGICVRGNDGRLLTAPGSGATHLPKSRLVGYLNTLPETDWADRRLSTYIPTRLAVCLQTFADVPDREVWVPLDLSIVVSTLPARAAELFASHESFGTDPACFEMTLDEARTLASELSGPAAGGSHEYWGILIRNRRLAAIKPLGANGIVAYVRFNALLPHRDSAAIFGS
jgi:hypothetical protein